MIRRRCIDPLADVLFARLPVVGQIGRPQLSIWQAMPNDLVKNLKLSRGYKSRIASRTCLITVLSGCSLPQKEKTADASKWGRQGLLIKSRSSKMATGNLISCGLP